MNGTVYPEILVIRHGQTAWNRDGRWQGALDSPLTEAGISQAHAMARALVGLGVGEASHDLFHSPQGRAAHTARIIAAATGQALRAEPLLREIGVGDWAGLTRDEVDRRWPAPDPHEHFLDRYARAPGGEPFADLWARVESLLRGLRRPAVLVTHGITSRFLRTCALGRDEAALADLPGGQGVVFRLRGGRHETLPAKPAPLAEPKPKG